MGRTVKPGISFYRMDAGHIQNKKVRLLYNEFDSDGYYIWHALIDYAYGHWGYYFDMNDQEGLELFASDYCKKKLTTIQEVITGCLRRGLFEQTVADAFGILTSDMMQETFLIATSERRAKGSVFEMRSEWLLIDLSVDVPPNISIVPVNNANLPGKKTIVPPNNPQRREEKNRVEKSKENTGSPPAPPRSTGKAKKPKNKFIEPTPEEMQAYFIKVMGRRWNEVKCRNTADLCIDHYIANGWVQKAGKPIVNWRAAGRQWIRRDLSGDFGRQSAPAPAKTVPPVVPLRPELSKDQVELNFLFGRFLEDPLSITVISIDPDHYNFLKKSGMVLFSQEETDLIRKLATDHIAVNKLECKPDIEIRFMKKFGVLEFFKQLKNQAKETVFEHAKATA